MLLTDIYPLAPNSKNPARIATVAVNCGEPHETANDIELFDFNGFLTGESEGVFFVRVVGDSMETEIFEGDLLIVNRNLQPNDGDKILASLNGSFTVKIFRKSPTLQLVASNGKYMPKKINKKDDFQIFGVVTHVIHSLRKF